MTTYLNVNEAAAELEISTPTIYKIVNLSDMSKRLNPVNRTTYKGDGGYRFLREELDRIKPAYVKSDLTITQAAQKIGRSKTFIQKLLKEGIIPYYEDELRGKKTFFIKENDLIEYKNDNPDSGKYDTIYDKKTGVFLFQSFIKDGLIARVVEMKRVNRYSLEIILQTGTESRFTYEKAKKDGWVPSITLTPRNQIVLTGTHVLNFLHLQWLTP
jgi:hypothetical protein